MEAELSVAGKKIQSEVCASPYNLKRIIRKKKKKMQTGRLDFGSQSA
jgi:hypothetical protein